MDHARLPESDLQDQHERISGTPRYPSGRESKGVPPLLDRRTLCRAPSPETPNGRQASDLGAGVPPRLKLPVPILMYHQIAQRAETNSRLAVSPDAWAEQLAYLQGQGYKTITVADLSVVLSGRGELPDRAVVLTFDDGYEDFHRRALPFLDRYGFTATLFVTTGWIQDAGHLSAGRRPGQMLSWTQIREAAEAGIEIAAHGRLHLQLDQLPRKLLREELYTSRTQLEDKLGSPVTGLAYPFGYSNMKVRQVARDLGHDYACEVGNTMMRKDLDLLVLPRLTINRATSMVAFQQVVHGVNLQTIYFKDRILTKGWAIARRARAAVDSLSHGD
jgi:peptidoglycan/xylan/chitin deacetylase (PgdA/CDA1 family)